MRWQSAVVATWRWSGVFTGIPTWRESGVDSVFSSSLGIVAPKGITADQIAYWENLIRQMTQSEEWKNLMERNQSRSNFLGHADATRFYDQEYQSMRTTVMELGLLGAGK